MSKKKKICSINPFSYVSHLKLLRKILLSICVSLLVWVMDFLLTVDYFKYFVSGHNGVFPKVSAKLFNLNKHISK